MRRASVIGMILALAGCGSLTDTPGRFGEVTSAVVLVNPVVNPGSTTSETPGSKREDVAVKIGDLQPVATDATGLALVERIATGTVPLRLDAQGSLTLNVAQEDELYDVAVVLREDGSTAHLFEPVRYPIGGSITRVGNASELRAAVKQANAVVLLAPGAYEGDLAVSDTGVLIFGAWNPQDGPLSTIAGNVSMTGSGGRLRGLEIQGNLHVPGGDFSMAFSKVASADINGNMVFLLRNEFTAGPVTVTGQNTILVDNDGL